jgi:lysophospholipase L1-like esterase
MRKLFTILFFMLLAVISKGQIPTYGFPTLIPGNSKPQVTLDQGTRATLTGYVDFNFADTTTANLNTFIKNTPFIEILVAGSQKWVRNVTASAWVLVSGGSSSTPAFNVGTMYSKKLWPDLSDFIDQSSGASISGNKIYFSGGSGVFTKTLGISMYNGLETYETSVIFIADTTNYASTNGIGIGSRSANAGFLWQFAARFFLTNTSDSGKIALYIGGGAYTQVVKSSTAITFAQGDRILFKVSADKNVITVTASNITTIAATSPISIVYQYNYAGTPAWVANTGNISIFNLGGKFHIDSIGWQSNEPINASMFIGDSKTTGGVVTDVNYRFGQKYNNSYGRALINSGVSDQTAQIKLLIPQIINYIKPKQVFLSIGSNDLRAGVPNGTWQANYNYIDSALIANGIVVYNLTPFPETVLDQSALYSYILSTYAANRIIDTYDALKQCGNCLFADGVHPNDAGNDLIFTTIKNFSPPYADKLNNPVFNLRNQRTAFQDFNFWVDTAITQWVRVNTTASNNYRINAPDSVMLNGIIFSKARSGFSTPTLHVPGGFLSIQNDNSGVAAGANLTIFESVDNNPVEIRLSSVNLGRTLTGGVGIINGFNYNSGTRQPLYITTSGFGATKAGPVIIRPGTNWSNASLGFGNSGDSAIIELNPSSTYKAKFYVNGKQDVQDTFTAKAKNILFTTVGGSSDSVLVKSSGGDTRAIAQSSVSGANIYNTDGTLTGSRTVTLGIGTQLLDFIGNNVEIKLDDPNSNVNISANNAIVMSATFATMPATLKLAGTTSSFPSIVQNGAGISFLLADASAYTTIAASSLLAGAATFNLVNTNATTINFAGASGNITNFGGGASAAEFRFLEPSGSGSNYTGFKAQAQAGNVTYTLPAADGSPNQFLQTNGSGALTWATASGGGSGITVGTTTITSGTTTRILYDNAGIVGEYTVTGSGTTAVLSTTPTFTTSIIDPLVIGSTSANGTLTMEGNNAGAGNTGTSSNLIFKVGDTPTQFMDILNNGMVRIGSAPNTTSGFAITFDQPDDGSDLKGWQVRANNHSATLSAGYDKLETSGAFKIGSASTGVEFYGPTGTIASFAAATTAPTSGVSIFTSLGLNYVAKTANYTLTSSDYLVNCTSNSFTITLPTAVGCAGRIYIIKNTGTATTITIATNSSQTIDGSAPGIITTLTPLRLMSDGANWITV